MATATTSAKSDSSRNQPMTAGLLPRAPLARCAGVAVLALAAGCVTAPPEKPGAGPATAASLPAHYRLVAFDALPGWSDDRVQEAWPAFRVGCTALAAPAAATRVL